MTMNRVTWFFILLSVCACSRGQDKPTADVIRVGYFPNVTHAQAVVGIARGDFQRALGTTTVRPIVFNAGPSAIEALFANQIDLTYIGPNPAINGYVQSRGEALRIVAGATSAGASFVVRADAGIRSPADLAGKRIATPQIGNTQDVALRAFLRANGLETREKGGSVEVIPTQNPQILDLVRLGQIDGAWVPEPWASRLVIEAGCTVLLDERDLWPNGDFVTAHVVVRREYLEEHPDIVKAWLGTHVDITQWLLDRPEDALPLLNQEIEKLTGKALPPDVLAMAWSRLRPTWDPIAPSLIASADAAHAAGYLATPPDLSGIYALSLLNEVLRERNLTEVPIAP
jgi:NitT/TauT family transport system substrate-binding protein